MAHQRVSSIHRGSRKQMGTQGNGSESSRPQAKYSTVHHYYCVLKAFFNWCVREEFISESPLVKIKLKNPKLNVVQPYSKTDILKMLEVCDNEYKIRSQFLGSRSEYPPSKLRGIVASQTYLAVSFHLHVPGIRYIDELFPPSLYPLHFVQNIRLPITLPPTASCLFPDTS